MCGIFAYLNNEMDNNSLEEMFQHGKNRGPEQSIFKQVNTKLFLGFHRLAINGLNVESSQPIHYNNYTLIANGEIFNYKSLVERHQFVMNTQSDCEVILHMYEKFGCESFKYLNGEFSFLLCDGNKVIICRDTFGIRPLYINQSNKGIFFSSVLKGVMHEDLSINDIYSFTPGTYSVYEYKNNNYIFQSNTCYRNVYEYRPLNMSKSEMMKESYSLLKESIIRRIETSERDLCCLLSGGLDSSIVSAISSEYYKSIGKKLHTFSIGLEHSEDLIYARILAKHIDSEHHEVICSEQTFIDSIPYVIKDVESYDTTTIRASVGNWLIGKHISENTDFKVVLNGDGADELMGGYLYFNSCPSQSEFHDECVRLLKNIHYFDVLRSERSISSHGLESRTPFLDIAFVEHYLSIPIHYRKGSCEKEFIREAIQENNVNLLPFNILWRKKEAFSDGVSGQQRAWFQIIHESLHQHDLNENDEFTKEQFYYRNVFNNEYSDCFHLIPYYWMPKYSSTSDPSARTLSIYQRNILYEYFYFFKHFISRYAIYLYRKFIVR